MGWLFTGVVLLAVGMTGWVRSYALRQGMVDLPGERSSHVVPTPRGGGISFILLLPFVLFWASWQGMLPVAIALVFMGCTLALALLGWVDDHRSLSARLRFFVQVAVAMLGLFCLPVLPSLPLPGIFLPEFVFWALLLVAVVWLSNLYNFMDGIDGLATLEGLSVLLGGAVLLGVSGGEQADLLLLLCAPLLGFLVWNFPVARIFMGDVCSAPLGLLLALLGVWLATVSDVNLWCWLILLSLFIADATCTLLVRMRSGQRWTEPHRSHAYQILSRRWKSHPRVSALAVLINLCWLLPWAWLAMTWPHLGGGAWLLALAPLLLVCYRLGAGRCVAN